jgi:hypothetical protein
VLLDEKIVAVARALEGAGIPHAFGGALALAYYATPRATHDVDLNLFVPASEAARVVEALSPLGVAFGQADLRRIARDGQARVFWEHTPLDLFFSYDALHERCLERRQAVSFGRDTLHVLSAEDLIIFKVIFDREKDWRDVAELLFASGERVAWDSVRDWLGRILPGDDPRHARLEVLIESGGTRLAQ